MSLCVLEQLFCDALTSCSILSASKSSEYSPSTASDATEHQQRLYFCSGCCILGTSKAAESTR